MRVCWFFPAKTVTVEPSHRQRYPNTDGVSFEKQKQDQMCKKERKPKKKKMKSSGICPAVSVRMPGLPRWRRFENARSKGGAAAPSVWNCHSLQIGDL